MSANHGLAMHSLAFHPYPLAFMHPSKPMVVSHPSHRSGGRIGNLISYGGSSPFLGFSSGEHRYSITMGTKCVAPPHIGALRVLQRI